MRTVLTPLVFIAVATVSLYGQFGDQLTKVESDATKARRLGMEGIHEADAGNYDRAIALFTEANRLDSSNTVYRYEIAYALYQQKKYEESLSVLLPVVDAEDGTDKRYALLAHAYGALDDADKAEEAYEKGLRRYPESGALHQERGMLAAMREDMRLAVDYWERGIDAEPGFAGNYYWAARYYCGSNSPLWGLMYAEIFLNLERGTQRTVDMSKYLYSTFEESIMFDGDSVRFKFIPTLLTSTSPPRDNKLSLNVVILKTDGSGTSPEAVKNLLVGFPVTFATTFMLADIDTVVNQKPGLLQSELDLTIENLTAIRRRFIKIWYTGDKSDLYTIDLFEWHKTLIELGYFEAYNFWLMRHGASEEMKEWQARNQKSYRAFTTWFANHPMPLDPATAFCRLRLEETLAEEEN